MVTRAEVERAAWAASGWSQHQAVVDDLMAVVDAYVTSAASTRGVDSGETAPAVASTSVDLVDLDLAVAPPVDVVVATAAAEPEVSEPPAENDGELVQCTRCLAMKPKSAFGKDSKRKTGLAARCRPCMAIVRKKWRNGQGRPAQTR